MLDRNEKVLYLSRLDAPYEFREKTILFKQLGLIAFKNNILEKFYNLEETTLEKAEALSY